MKKLTALLLTIATGLFAFGVDTGFKFSRTTFEPGEGYVAGTTISNATQEASGWYWFLAAGADEESGTVKADKDNDGNITNQYLEVETGAVPLYRTISNKTSAATMTFDQLKQVDIGSGIFFDAKVKFTPSAEPPTLADGDKFAVWAYEQEDGEGNLSTNLMVTAGSRVSSGGVVATNFTLAVADNFDYTAWHRLTIRSLNEVSADEDMVSGFLVFLDRDGESELPPVAVADTEDYTGMIGCSESDISTGVKKYFTNKQLFLSAGDAGKITNQKLQVIGLQGSGAIDDLQITDYENAPGFARGTVQVAVNYTVGDVTGFEIWANGNTKVPDEKITKVDGTWTAEVDGMTSKIVVKNIATATGKMVVNYTDSKDKTIEFPAETGGTIETATIGFVVDGVNYPADEAGFTDALAAAQLAGVPMVLKADFTMNLDTTFASGVELKDETIIDLASKNIVASGEASPAEYVFFCTDGGKLTVIDSLGGGAIKTNVKDIPVISLDEGCAFVLGQNMGDKGATIDGVISGSDGIVSLVNGYVNKTDNETIPAEWLAEGKKAYEVELEGKAFWEIKDSEGFTLTLVDTGSNASISSVPAAGTVEEGANVVVTATPNPGYEYATAPAGWSSAGGGAYTTNFTMTADITVTAPTATIKKFTVTVPSADHTTVAVTNGEIEAGTDAKSYEFDYGTKVAVVYTPITGYKITANGSTNIASLVENVTVTAPTVAEILVTSVTLSETSTNVVQGESFTLVATVEPEDALDKTIAWTSSDESVAKVENGVVTTINAGTATITATNTKSGEDATCTVTVAPPTYTMTIPKVEHATVAAISNGTDEVVFTTDSSSGVTTFTIVSNATVKIYFKPDDGYKLDQNVVETTINAAGEISVTAIQPALITYNITFDPAATNGKVETSVTNNVEPGTEVEVTTTADEGYALDTLTVKKGNEAITVTDGKFTMPAADVKVTATFTQLVFTVTFVTNGAPYAVSNAVPYGTAFDDVKPTKEPTWAGYTFDGWTPDGVEVKADATYTAKWKEIMVTSVTLSETSTNVVQGESFTLTATVGPEDALDKTIAWTSSDENVAKVVDGAVTTINAGTATITATNAASGKFATCQVGVAVPEYTVMIPTVDNATIVAVSNDTDDVGIDLLGTDPETFKVLSNKTVTVYFAPADGYKLDPSTVTTTIKSADPIDVSSIVPQLYVAQIVVSEAVTKYTSLSEAFDAVDDGQTIEMIADYTIATATTLNKETATGITLDLNEKTLTGGVKKALVIAGADTKLTIANGEYVSNFDNALRAENGATVTIAADAVITGIACVQAVNATLNVYGDIEITGDDDAIDAYSSVINIYDGALVKTTGEECSGVCMVDFGYGVGTVNLNGGEIEAMYAIYDYSGDDTAANINLIGGTIKGYLNNCVSLNGKLTDECTTLFTIKELPGLFSIDAFCATGYEPTEVTGGWQITIKKFDVTFKASTYESDIVSNAVPYGTLFEKVKPAEDPTPADGFLFKCWEPVEEKVTNTTTYTAVFTNIEYTLTLKAGANTTLTASPAKDTYHIGEIVKLTATTNAGYRFASTLPEGWQFDDDGAATNIYTIVAGENAVNGPAAGLDTVTFTVKGITGAELVAVATNAGGDVWVKIDKPYTVSRGALVLLTFKAADGYKLTDTEFTTTVSTDDAEVDASSEIEPIALYTVTFKVEGQADYVTNSIPSNTEFAVIRPADPTAPTGQSFKCWEPVEEFVVSNTTYTAAFTNNFYDITFKNADDTWNEVVSTEYNVMPVAPAAPPVEGHSFSNWTPTVVAAVEDATYTAVYTANVYAVTFANGANSTITPAAGTQYYDYGTELAIAATADEDYEFAAENYEDGWLKTDDCTKLTNSYTVTDTKTFTAPAATPAPVTITIPSAVDGVSSLVISQNVGGVWEEVTGDPKKIAVGNEWAVYATVVEGKTVLNPVATGTAAVGTAIEVTADDIKAKIGIQTFTVEVTLPENAMVAVITNDATEAAAGTTAATYTFDYGTKVDVVYTPNEGYHITANAETNIASLVADVVVTAPTVEINTYDITFTDAAAWTNVVPTTHGATPAPTENIPEVEGHSFSDWTPTVAAAVADATYTAVYTANVYAVTFANGENSTITPAEGTVDYDYGTALEIVATAAEDYEFAAASYEGGWLKTDDCTKLTNSYVVTGEKTFTAPNATAISYAAWIKVGESGAVQKFRNYDEALAAIQAAEAAGTYPIAVTIKTATVNFPVGTTINIDATGWAITGDANLVGIDIAAGKTVKVNGALTYSGKVSGTLKAASLTIPSDGAITIDTNGTVTVTGTTTLTAADFTAVDGYKVIKADDSFTFKVTKLHTATFTVDTTTIESVSYTVNGGTSVSYTDPITGLIKGDTITLTVTPMSGYEYKGATEFTVGDADIVQEISAKNETYNITFEIGATSIISNDVPYGTSFTNVAPAVTAPEGTSLKGWTPEVTMIDGTELTFTAVFTNNFYTLTLTDGAKGSISSTPTAGLVEYGTAVKVTVTPDAGYQFDPIPEGWTAGDNGTIVSNFTMAAGNVAITAPDAVVIKTGFAIIIAGDTPTTNYYPTLAAAIEAAGTGDLPGTVTLLEDATLTETLTIAKQYVVLDLNGKTMTLGENLTAGIKITADSVTVKNGTIASSLTANALKSKAIEVAHANVKFENLTINAAHYEYAIYANCDEACGDDLAWFYTQASFKMLVCDGVAITGNGSLFHVEGMVATLNNCSAIADGNELFANEAHRAAVYSSVNARTTITGSGTYTHEKALLSGNLGGKITVDTASTAAFTGVIYSWMQADAHDDLEIYDDYKAEYVLDGGTYNNCTVAFKEDGARNLDSFTKNSLIAIPAPEGYIWYNDITLGKPIVATFMVDDAVYAAETNIVAFTPATPTDPTLDGKTFTGWDPEIAPISASQEYVAQFEDQYFDVTFADAADGSATITPAAGTSNLVWGTVLEITAKAVDGSEFVGDTGWAVVDAATVKTNYTVKADANFTAPQAVSSTIAVNVTWDVGSIAGVKANGGDVVAGAVKFPRTTTEVAFELTTALKVPVYTVTIDGVAAVTNKAPVLAVTNGMAIAFSAEEAKEDDVTEDQAKGALVDAGMSGEKLAAITTDDDPVTAKEVATWAATHGGDNVAEALSGDYVGASVKLDVDPIETNTTVEVVSVDADEGLLKVTIEVAGADVTKEEIEGYVWLCGSLGGGEEPSWVKMLSTDLQKAVTIEGNKLVITPKEGIKQLFLKVIIPKDAK